MPLTDDELRQKAEGARVMCGYHLGRWHAFEEARGAPQDKDASPSPDLPKMGRRCWFQRIVLDIMRSAGASLHVGDIHENALRQGKDITRAQIRSVLKRLESRGIVERRGAVWRIVQLAQAIAAMNEDDLS